MIARIRIDPAEWPRSDGVLVERSDGSAWRHVGLYALREREIDVEVEAGDTLRLAGFRRGAVPHGAPAGFEALLLSDYVEFPIHG